MKHSAITWSVCLHIRCCTYIFWIFMVWKCLHLIFFLQKYLDCIIHNLFYQYMLLFFYYNHLIICCFVFWGRAHIFHVTFVYWYLCHQVNRCAKVSQHIGSQWLKCWHSTLEALIGFEFHLRLDFSPPIALIFQVNVIMNPQINGCNLNKI